MEPLLIRPMTSEDLPGIEQLSGSRNVHRREYERFLGLEGAHGLVLESGSTLVGAVTVMRYFEHGFVGPVLLRAEAEGVGLSLALLARAIEGLQRAGVTLVEAEATRDEAVLLANLGFHEVRSTAILERPPDAAKILCEGTRAMRPDDLLEIGALDAGAAGYGRKEYILSLLREFPDGARVVESSRGEILGYALLRRSKRGYHLGPLVTRGAARGTADALVRACVAQVPAWPVVALAPHGTAASDLLRAHGFAPVGELVRMRAGQRDPATSTEWLLGGRITG